MKKTKYKRYYRHPKTTSEKRASYAYEGYVRAKRNASNLPDAWDDEKVVSANQKNWKNSRLTQYRCGTRGKKHIFYLEGAKRSQVWNLKEYFENHDIPFSIVERTKSVRYVYPIYESVKDRYIPYYVRSFRNGVYSGIHQAGWYWTYKRIDTGRTFSRRHKSIIGYNVTWWSNKDIGVEYILARTTQ